MKNANRATMHRDPPMKRSPGSVRWFESGPGPILLDPELATTIVKVGMASNAINSLLLVSRAVSRRRSSAAKHRDSLILLVSAAAYLKESVELARREMSQLRALADHGGMSKVALQRVGQLCAGKHPASETLQFARNKLGFHWDHDLVFPSVLAFVRTKQLSGWNQTSRATRFIRWRLRCSLMLCYRQWLPGAGVSARRLR